MFAVTNFPVYDYSEYLEEAQDRIEEKLIIEGDIVLNSTTKCMDCMHKEICCVLRAKVGNLQNFHEDCKYFMDMNEAADVIENSPECEAVEFINEAVGMIIEKFSKGEPDHCIFGSFPSCSKNYIVRKLFNGKKKMLLTLKFVSDEGR